MDASVLLTQNVALTFVMETYALQVAQPRCLPLIMTDVIAQQIVNVDHKYVIKTLAVQVVLLNMDKAQLVYQMVAIALSAMNVNQDSAQLAINAVLSALLKQLVDFIMMDVNVQPVLNVRMDFVQPILVSQAVLLHRYMDLILMDALALTTKNVCLNCVITMFAHPHVYSQQHSLLIKMDVNVLKTVLAHQISVTHSCANLNAYKQVL